MSAFRRRYQASRRWVVLLWAALLCGRQCLEQAPPAGAEALQAVLSVAPDSFAVTAAPETTQVVLGSTGADTLRWTVTEQAPWLWVESPYRDTRASGAVSGQGPVTLLVHTVGLGLPPGLYRASIVVEANGERAEVPVTLRVDGDVPLADGETRASDADAARVAWPSPFAVPVEQLLQVSAGEAEVRVWRQLVAGPAERFRFVATTPDRRLLAAVDPWQVSTWPDLGRQHGTHLLRSADGGRSWETVLRAMPVHICTNEARLHLVALDPQHLGHVLAATDEGLYRDGVALSLPPQAASVTALAYDPTDASRLYLATDRVVATCDYDQRTLSLPGLFRGIVDSTGAIAWEDLTTDLVKAIAPVDSLAVDPRRASVLYLHGMSGAVFRRDFDIRPVTGWEPVAQADIPPYVSLTPSSGTTEPFVRVPAGYIAQYVPHDADLRIGFLGLIYGRDGILYGAQAGEHFHMLYRYVVRSIDGGLSWQRIWGGGAFWWEPSAYAWDGRDFVYVTGSSMTGEAAVTVGPWAQDPVDPLCLYVAQQGRGRLFRTVDSGQSWEEISTPLAPTLDLDGLGVDSLSTVYVCTADGCFRHRQSPRPVRLTAVHAWPDTLVPGQGLTVTARLEPRAAILPPGRMVCEYRGQTVLHEDGRDGDMQADDGVYSARLAVPPDAPVGFYRVPVWFGVEGQPLARASGAARLLVQPRDDVAVYADGPAEDWSAAVLSGQVEVQSRAQAHSGCCSCALDGAVDLQYAAPPLYPFGYVLQLWVYDAAGGTALDVEDAHLAGVEGGRWTRVEVPAEALHAAPVISLYGDPSPAVIASLHLASSGPLFLDDLRLVAARPAVLSPSAVSEAPGASRPQQVRLYPGYPNPFNSATNLRFALPAAAQVELVVYDLAGQRVTMLLSGQQQAGMHTVPWDGRDAHGRPLSTGVYLCRLRVGTRVATARLLLLR